MNASPHDPEQAAGPGNPARPGLAYIRIPKTASSTVVRQIKTRPEFGLTGCAPARGFLEKHATWEQLSDLLIPGSGWISIATFRDPLERLISFYRYMQWLTLNPNILPETVLYTREAAARPLRELVLDENSLLHGSSYPVQTFYLGLPLTPDRHGRLRVAAPPDPESTGRALRLALERLERLAWIGLAETIDRDLETLAVSQGWPPFPSRHLNRARPFDGGASADLDVATRRLLADRLAPDYVLVEAAREIAAERHRAAVGDRGAR